MMQMNSDLTSNATDLLKQRRKQTVVKDAWLAQKDAGVFSD